MPKIFLFILIVAFSALSLCGVGAFNSHMDHSMSSCPLTSHVVTLCPPKSFDTDIAAVLISFIILLGASFFTISTTPSLKRFLHPIEQASFFNPLALAISDGIVQPKVYHN